MIITLYSNFSKRDNSTKQPTGGISYECTLKSEFSLYGGTLILQESFDTAKYFTAASYGGWYYKVWDVVSSTNNIIEVTLKLDELATFKGDIASYNSMISRSPSDANIGLYPDITIRPKQTYSRKGYGLGSTGGVCFQIKTQNQRGVVAYFCDMTAYQNLLDKTDTAFWTDYTKYIISACVVPVSLSSISGGTSTNVIYLGKQNFNVSGSVIAIDSASISDVFETSKETSAIETKYSDARRFLNEYTALYFKTCGQLVQIDSNYLRGSRFSLNVELDNITLDARVTLEIDNHLIYTNSTNLGVPTAFTHVNNALGAVTAAVSSMMHYSTPTTTETSSTTYNNIARKTKEYSQNSEGSSEKITDTVDKSVKQTHSITSGGDKLINPTVAAAADAAIAAYTSSMTTNTVPTSPGSTLAAVYSSSADIELILYDSMDKNPSEFGYPYNEITSIDEVGLTGFYQFASPSLNIAAPEGVKNNINAYLATGFFYE